MKEPRSWLDRTAIVVRSHHDHGFLPRVFPTVRWRSDAPCISAKRRKSGFTCPSDRDRAAFALMKISAPRVATWHQVSLSIVATYPVFCARGYLMIAWTRVHAIFDVLIASNACRVATFPAKGKSCGNIVPHGRRKETFHG